MSTFGDKLLGALDDQESKIHAAARRVDEERRAGELAFRQACGAAHDLVEGVFQPMLAEFQKILQGRDVLRQGRVRLESPALYRDDAGIVRLVFRALGAARARRCYEVRIITDVRTSGIIKYSAACVHYLPADSRRVAPAGPEQPLVEFSDMQQDLRAGRIDSEAAREWCEGILARSAAAVMEANLSAHTAAGGAVCAPIVTVPIITAPLFAAGGVFST